MSQISYVEKQEIVLKSKKEALEEIQTKLSKNFQGYPNTLFLLIRSTIKDELQSIETQLKNLYQVHELFGD